MENTARNFVLQLGSLIALYIALSALVAVMFGVINIKFPDAIEGYWQYESAQQMIRFGVALLLVFFPTYIILTRLVNKIRRREEGTYLKLTKWLVYLSLLVGGGILLGDLVAVVNQYLNGEITTRFILKAATLLVMVGTAFFYYILDARGYWTTHEKEGIQFAIGASIIAVVVLVLGFTHSDTPMEVRDVRLDEIQTNDLMSIQNYVEQYYRVNDALPADLGAAYSGSKPPVAPEMRPAYAYEVVNDTTFKLCATFKNASPESMRDFTTVPFEGQLIKNPNDWTHGSGEVCFERIMLPVPAETTSSIKVPVQ